MKKRFLRTFATLALSITFLHIPLFAADSDITTDLNTIYTRQYHAAMAGSDKAASKVPGILTLLNDQGLFTDLDYHYTTFNAGGTLQPHLSRLNTLVYAFFDTTSSWFQNTDLKQHIYQAMSAWLEKDPQDGNWWWRRIGWPMTAMATPIIMKNILKKERPDLLDAWVEYLLYSWRNNHMDGANATDIQKIALAAATIADDYSLMQDVVTEAKAQFQIVSGSADGFYSDGSYHQHNGRGRQLYHGTYGIVYLKGFNTIASLMQGTPLAFSPQNIAVAESFFLDAVRYITFRDYADICVFGRGYGRNAIGPQKSTFNMVLKDLIDLNPPRKDKLSQYRVGSDSTMSANHMFYHADFMSHKRAGWYTSARGTSKRTVGNESGNDEGLKNYHMGDGVNLVLVHGDEYDGIYPVWDWRRIPGTTIEQNPGPLPLVDWGQGAAGATDFAGGVSDGRYGVYSFMFDEDNENKNVKANKSWFFFDDEYVALGAGIDTKNASHDVYTSINQTKLKGGFTVHSGTGTKTFTTGSKTDTGPLWVVHNDIGYLLSDYSGTAVVRGASQSGSWRDLYSAKSNELITQDIFSIWINHGSGFDNGFCQYTVVPGADSTSMAEYAANPPVSILSNTATVQAVYHNSLNLYGIVFYKASNVKLEKGLNIASDQPLALLLHMKKDGITLYAATPQYKALTATISISGQYNGEGVKHDSKTNKTTFKIDLPGENDAGSTVSMELIRP